MSHEPIIRRARPADMDSMAVPCDALGSPVSRNELEERLQQIQRRSEHIVLVAELPNIGVVGWIHGAASDSLVATRRCEIRGLVIHAAATRIWPSAGVNYVEHWAVKEAVDHITVRSNVARCQSHPFYDGLGYSRTKTQHGYTKCLVCGSI